MGIDVHFQPNFAAVGALAAQVGAGQRQDQLGLAYDQMAQQRQMQRAAMANQFLQNQQQMAFQANQNALNRFANNQLAQLQMFRDDQRFQQGMIADRMAFQDRFALGERAAENQMIRDEHRQRLMEQRQMALKEEDSRRQMAIQEEMMRRQMMLNDANFRSRAGEYEFREQLGFEQELSQLPLNDSGKQHRDELWTELDKIRDHSSDLRDEGVQYALQQWRRQASELFDPRYQQEEKNWQEIVNENTFQLPGMPNTVLFRDPETGKFQHFQNRSAPSDDMSPEKVVKIAGDLMRMQGPFGQPMNLEQAMQKARTILSGHEYDPKWADMYQQDQQMKRDFQQQQFAQSAEGDPEAQLHMAQSAQNYGETYARHVGKAMSVDLNLDPFGIQDPVEADHQVRNCMADILALKRKFGSVENFPPEILPIYETLVESAMDILAMHFPEEHQRIAVDLFQALQRAREVRSGGQAGTAN